MAAAAAGGDLGGLGDDDDDDGADGDDDGDDDDGAIDPDSLGDWRAFRRDLALGGAHESGFGGEGEGTPSNDGKKKKEAERRSVSRRNEELLMSQSEELAEEYVTGVWAHEAPNAEVGGLLCRLPLEAELYRNSDHSLIGAKLRVRLSLDRLSDSDDDYYYDGDGAASGDDGTGTQASEPTPLGSSPGVSFSPLAARTVFWYRGAQSLIREEIGGIAAEAVGGRVDAERLGPEAADMLRLYLDHQDTWQEVCLVLDARTTVVLNRPMALRSTENLSRLVLFGAAFASGMRGPTPEQTELLGRFRLAFGDEIGLYVGGPDMMDRPALMVHGVADLEGAEEVAPGTGIYMGGLEAAVDGVLSGARGPLDFRFFVGRHRYADGSGMDLAVRLGKYQPVACARSLALKQCIALPKPLWHEVMELCGGELKEISSLELMKRDDIQVEQVDE